MTSRISDFLIDSPSQPTIKIDYGDFLSLNRCGNPPLRESPVQRRILLNLIFFDNFNNFSDFLNYHARRGH